MIVDFRRSSTNYSDSATEKGAPPSTHPHNLIQENTENVLRICITIWYGNFLCLTEDHCTDIRKYNQHLCPIYRIYLHPAESIRPPALWLTPSTPPMGYSPPPIREKVLQHQEQSSQTMQQFVPEAIQFLNTMLTRPSCPLFCKPCSALHLYLF